MATIHFIGGEKGGVGKSLVSRILAQYMIDQGIPFLGFDTDRSHGSLLRFYSDYASPVVIDRFESLDTLFEAATESAEKRVLVDLAAQTYDLLVRWMDESGVLETAAELGISVRYWHVMDSGKDSVDLLGKLFDRFGDRLSYTIVLNQLRGSTFELLDASGVKERAAELQAKFVSIKRLHDSAIAKIDGRSTSFWAAQNNPDKGVTGLGLLDRQRVKVWLRNAYAEVESVGV
ncbi:MAG TPA: mobilization protein [Verrucomicrobiales bacterium]|mgnify:CR=1 FL=1|nr:mobilization protein [Verrucomicrobiales bacterium]